MNRASGREVRLVAMEEQIRGILQQLDEFSAAINQLRESRDLTTRALLKLSRELGAQREKYPLHCQRSPCLQSIPPPYRGFASLSGNPEGLHALRTSCHVKNLNIHGGFDLILSGAAALRPRSRRILPHIPRR